MNEKSQKKQSFLQGVAVLTFATIIVKLLGFIYKVPLQNILQERGFGYFNTAYDVYNVLLMISTTGLPVAVSRMISQAQALDNYAQIRKIYSTSMKVFLSIGIVGTLIMLVFCRQLSVMVTTNENSWAAIAALSPCVLLICVVSAHRGFFQGQSNMTPTSVSQIYEAVVRVVFGLAGAYLMLRKTGSLIYAAAGGIFGVTIGCIVAVVYLRIQFGKSNQVLQQGGGEAKSTRATMKELVAIAIPITLGSAGLQIINLVDTMIYMRRLTGALAWSSDAADTAKGIYNYCQTIFNLPCSLVTPITISVIPTVTAALTTKNLVGARHTEESAVRTMAIITMPCAVGLAVLAEPIIRLLARNYGAASIATATPILIYLGIAVIFNSTVLLFNSIMQAHGDVTTPVINMLIGGVVKVIVNYILVAIPSLNIIGAAIGTVICYATITALDVIAMRKRVTTRPAILRNMVRPFGAAVGMGALTWATAALLSRMTSSNTIVCLSSLVVAVIVYVIFVIALRCVTYEDCMLFPKGEKIAKILHAKHRM